MWLFQLISSSWSEPSHCLHLWRTESVPFWWIQRAQAVGLKPYLGWAKHGLAIIGHWPWILMRPVDSNLSPYSTNQWLALPLRAPHIDLTENSITVSLRCICGTPGAPVPEKGTVQL